MFDSILGPRVQLLCLLTLLMVAPGLASAQTCSAWGRTAFDARNAFQAVYDAARSETVVFGGQLVGPGSSLPVPRSGETWTWDGMTWTRKSLTGPSPRSNYAMTFDAARQKVVLFGGFDGTTYFGDTWEWDGEQWTRVATTGPSPRSDAAMTFDSARGVIVLFGGGTSLTRFGGTWEWNGKEWTLRTESGPPARVRHAMGYDPVRNVTILSGGTVMNAQGSSIFYRDTWAWNGKTWTPKGESTSTNRYAHQIVFDANVQALVMFGGAGSFSQTNSVLQWDGTAWIVRTIAAPIPSLRFNYGMTFDSARNVLILTCGATNNDTVLGDTWELSSANAWSQRTSSVVPSPRADFAMDFDPGASKALVFGLGTTRESWLWDAATGIWTLLTTVDAPTNAQNTVMVFDPDRHVFVLTGGGREETWEFAVGGTWVSRKLISPPARNDPAMCYDPVRKVMVLFGGVQPNTNTYLSDTWEYDGEAWTRAAVSGPPAKIDSAMAYDAANGRMLLFGGSQQNDGYTNDTWAWDGQTWTLLNPPNKPSRRRGHSMVVDAARGVVVLLGGQNNTNATDLADPWEWINSDWVFKPVQRPIAPRQEFGMFYNKLAERINIFGGIVSYPSFGSVTVSELWELTNSTAPILPASQASFILNSGSAVTLSVPPSGTSPVSYLWSHNGSPLQDSERIIGSATRELQILSLSAADAGDYSIAASNDCGSADAVIAHVTVKCPGDANNDNMCNGQDLSVLLSSFGNTTPPGTGADFNTSGSITGADLSVLLARFGQGCSTK